MKYEVETQFNVGDKVWRKNLVTNVAEQFIITRIDVYLFIENDKESYVVLYHDGFGMISTNINGKIEANNAFATKEEADACPRYIPE